MQKQVEDFNRSVTIIFWYKVCRDPLVKTPPVLDDVFDLTQRF